jgi:hypothetical protein
MSASYDPTLPSDKDWVRFLIGDRDITSPNLEDEEILAVLTEEANKYLAAFRCGNIIFNRGLGAITKSVDDLSITYSDSADSAYMTHLKKLEEEGCRRLLKVSGSSVFRVL